jgi:hypothetical protein
MDSEMRREIARHRQADLSRLAQKELLLADVVLPPRMVALQRLFAGLGKTLRSLTRLGEARQEQVPDAPVEVEGPA